ncbi:MAG: flippase-like domain-containing protein [Acidobacteria bacterium]|nr:flippase-like domain-containing protein [Acidobacteriota bacterium]
MTASIPRWAVPLVAAGGAALLAALVVHLGPSVIARQLAGLAPILPIVLALGAIKYGLQTIGWRLVLRPAERPPWSDAICATIAGDAVGYLTWAGPFSSEPTRAVLTRHLVPVGASVAAGAAERFMYSLTSALLIVAVPAVLALRRHPTWQPVAWTASCLLVLSGWWLWTRRHERPPRASRSWGRPLDAVRTFWREHHGVAPVLGVLCLGQHATLVLEAYVMLNALGALPTIGAALVFEVVSKLVNTAGSAVPGRIGISEGGSALLARALGYEASLGLSLALMRRVRAAIWTAVGLLMLVVQERRARRTSDGEPTSRRAS